MSDAYASAVRRKIRQLTVLLFCIWVLVAFVWVFFARELDWRIGHWTLNFWMAAQGSLLMFLLLTVVNACLVNRWEKELPPEEPPQDSKTPPASRR